MMFVLLNLLSAGPPVASPDLAGWTTGNGIVQLAGWNNGNGRVGHRGGNGRA